VNFVQQRISCGGVLSLLVGLGFDVKQTDAAGGAERGVEEVRRQRRVAKRGFFLGCHVIDVTRTSDLVMGIVVGWGAHGLPSPRAIANRLCSLSNNFRVCQVCFNSAASCAFCYRLSINDRFPTLRQSGGLSGFCKMAESPHDAFGAGHSSTSISAAQGYSIAKTILEKPRSNCVAFIGDGAITGGMAYEAMNSAGYLKNRMIVILNDN